ncbi:helix-turn-helix transcriptional regulator [Patescibacteria group bacterium]|nr:helix-turn-helix transcriptional regulator [Patescibacteria group bacterium]
MKTKKETLDPQMVSQMREAREQKKMTQEEVAKKAGMTVTFYAMMERGEANPSVAKLNKVLQVLGLKILIKKA